MAWKCHDNDQPHLTGIDKVNKPIKILGVYFTYDSKKKQELNYNETLKSLSETLAGWTWQNLTLYGKIQVVKSLVIPKFMFRESLMCSTKKIIREPNSIINRFIWKGSDKIKRLALISDYKNGGLRMPHIKTLIDIQRIIRLKNTLRNTIAHGNTFFRSFSRTMVKNFSYIAISALPTYPTTFLTFTKTVSLSGPN